MAKRKVQQELPGCEQPRVEEIEDIAEGYHSTALQLKEVAKEKKALMADLVERMATAGLDCYETRDGLIVTVSSKTKCETKRKNRAMVETEKTETTG